MSHCVAAGSGSGTRMILLASIAAATGIAPNRSRQSRQPQVWWLFGRKSTPGWPQKGWRVHWGRRERQSSSMNLWLGRRASDGHLSASRPYEQAAPGKLKCALMILFTFCACFPYFSPSHILHCDRPSKGR